MNINDINGPSQLLVVLAFNIAHKHVHTHSRIGSSVLPELRHSN